MGRPPHPLVVALRSARVDAHLSQVDVADELSVNPRSVGQWERGERTPDLWRLAEFAAALGLEFTLTPKEAPRG